MSELIDRQMAIDAIKDALDPHIVQFVKAKMAIEALPSAQSEPTPEIQDILDYLDTVLHPIVSPEHWDVYSKLHDMVSGLPSAQPDHVADVGKKVGWIPCSERLPEKMGYYLTSNEYKVVHEDYYWGSGCFEKAKKYQCEVEAWMPMPIPPYYGGNGE